VKVKKNKQGRQYTSNFKYLKYKPEVLISNGNRIDAILVAKSMFWGKIFTGVYIDFARHFLHPEFQDGRRIPEVVITLRQKMIPRWSQRLWQCFRTRPIHIHQHRHCPTGLI